MSSRARAINAGIASPSATATPTPRPTPSAVRIRAVNLKPVGGVKRIRVKKGDIVRFTVTSDKADSVHLHGYDVEKPVGPGTPARYVFKASIDGIFEVELENAASQLISLRVDP
jgi:hypothetical protein